jgi:small subunit ribosomal protein S10
MATKGRIRVRLKSYDSRIIDSTCQQILDTAIRTGAKVAGPIPLPSKRSIFVVNKGPFIDKDAREHFQLKTHKRLIDILNPTDKTIESLIHLDLPAGVDVEIKM